MEKFLILVVVGVVLLFLFAPGIRQLGTRLTTSSEEITLQGKTFELVTLLGFDAIPSILEPSFVNVEEADAWMKAGEQVLGVSINGDNRAYSVKMLSRHEIVNDVVGGVPIAVTW